MICLSVFDHFLGLALKGLTEKQIKYFTCEFKEATNFGKLYLGSIKDP